MKTGLGFRLWRAKIRDDNTTNEGDIQYTARATSTEQPVATRARGRLRAIALQRRVAGEATGSDGPQPHRPVKRGPIARIMTGGGGGTFSMQTNAASKSASLILVPHACSNVIPDNREVYHHRMRIHHRHYHSNAKLHPRVIFIPSQPNNHPTPVCRSACGCMLVLALLLLLLLLPMSKISGAAATANACDAMYLPTTMTRSYAHTLTRCYCFTRSALALDRFFEHVVFGECDGSVELLHTAAATPTIHHDA